MIRVTIWHENVLQEESDSVRSVYKNGLSDAIKEFLTDDDFCVKKAFLCEKENGLTQEIVDNTDILIWWAHCKHQLVDDKVAARVVNAVKCGMGIIFLHSAHLAKPFVALMGTSCTLRWREHDHEHEWVWTTAPAHPIAEGIPERFKIENDEMYGEYFDVPKPDDTVFIGWFKGGNVFRSGLTYTRGFGKIFYFQPGHETYPVYYNKNVQEVIKNAIRWAKPTKRIEAHICPNESQSLEKLIP